MADIDKKRRFKRTLKTARRLQKQTLCGMDAAEEPTGLRDPELLTQHSCPEEILHFPAIGFAHLPDKLHRMKLR